MEFTIYENEEEFASNLSHGEACQVIIELAEAIDDSELIIALYEAFGSTESLDEEEFEDLLYDSNWEELLPIEFNDGESTIKIEGVEW